MLLYIFLINILKGFWARHYKDILLDHCFIKAIGVQLNLKSEPGEWKRCDPTRQVWSSIIPRLARQMLLTIKLWITLWICNPMCYIFIHPIKSAVAIISWWTPYIWFPRESNLVLYSKNIQVQILSIWQKFPRFDSRVNQIQGVHL